MQSNQHKKGFFPKFASKQIWQKVLEGNAPKKPSATLYEELSDANEEEDDRPSPSLLSIIRRLASLVALVLFVATLGSISYLCVLAWLPNDELQPVRFDAKAPAIDIAKRIALAGAGPVTFTEQELNQLLAQSCRVLQEGSFSIFSRPEALQINIQDGYAQVTISRMIGSDFHHHTTAHLQFYRQDPQGDASDKHSAIACKLQGGEPIFAAIPRGGQLGQLPIPARFITTLIPPLKRLAGLYPALERLVQEKGYLPVFTRDENGQKVLVLSPPKAIEFVAN